MIAKQSGLEEKTRMQRIIEYQVTNGRGYVRLPSYHPNFANGNPLQAWLYFSEHRREFNESKYSVYPYPNGIVPLSSFLIGSLISNYKIRCAMWASFSKNNGATIEQISQPFSKP